MELLSQFSQANPDARELKRALAVQMVLQNYRHREIQSVLQLSSGFISKWTQVFEQQGVAGLGLQHKGSKAELNFAQRQTELE